MAEKALLQQVLRRVGELRAAGLPAQEAAAEIKSLGWTPAEIKQRITALPPADSADLIAQSLTFGLAEEGASILAAPIRAYRQEIPLGEAYDLGLEERRAAQELYRQQNPKLALGADIAGGFGVPLPGGPAQTALKAIGRGALTAGAGGAAYGFGTGEGIGNRLERAAIGGGTGAAIGGGLGLGEGFLRSLWTQVKPGSTSRQMLAQALADEGLTPVQAAGHVAVARAAGSPGTTIADLGQEGGRLQGLLQDVTGSPNYMQSALRKQLQERQAGVRGPVGEMAVPGQYERLTERLGQVAGIGKQRSIKTLSDLAESKKVLAGPMFQRANQFDPASDPEVRRMLTDVLNSPLAREAWPRAIKIAQSRARGVPTPSIDDVIDQSGQIKVIPNMQFLHYLKEGMDGTVNRIFRKGDNTLGNAYKNVRNIFRDTLKERNPDYKAALNAFAGTSALEEAVEDGAALIMKSPDELADAVGRLSGSEQEAFRIGALTKVIDLLGGPRRGPARDVVGALNTPNFIKKLAGLMPDDAARQKWFAFADAEMAKSVSARAPFGSPTQPRREVAEMMEDGIAGDVLADVGRGISQGPWNLLLAGLGKINKGVANVAKRRRRGAMGELLSRTDEQAEALLHSLTARPPLSGYLLERLALPATTGVVSGTDILPEARPFDPDLGF